MRAWNKSRSSCRRCVLLEHVLFFHLDAHLRARRFNVRYRRQPRNILRRSHRPPVRTFGPVTASRIIAKSRFLVPEMCRAKIFPRCSRACCVRLPYEGCRVSGLLGLDRRPRFGKAPAHPSKNDLGRFAARFLDQLARSLVFLTVCVYRKLKPGRNGDEVRPGWRVTRPHRLAEPGEKRAHP